MWNKPNAEQLACIPRLYTTEHTPLQDKLIHLHFFIGGCDWYICEIDETHEYMWGFVVLNQDFQNAEWGYVSLAELVSIRVGFVEVDCDLYWKVRSAMEVANIRKAHPHWKRYDQQPAAAL